MLESKKNIKNIIISTIIVSIFLIIIYRVFSMTILKNKYYNNLLESLTNIYMNTTSSPRGRIYDRNNKLIVDNKSINTLYYKKIKNIPKATEIKYAYSLSNIIDLDYSRLSTRNLKEFYYLINKDKIDKRVSKKEYNKVKTRELTTNDIYNLKISRITEKDLTKLNDKDKKSAYIYYLMNNGYAYDNKIIKSNITDQEYAYIAEHSNEFKGFYIDISWVRDYKYGDVFKTMLGTVGEIPKEKKLEYLNKGYNLSDIVGLSYLEYQYEDYLKGEKSKYKVLSDGSLKLISKGKRGNDIVLNIDIELQKKVEDILDQEVIKTKSQINTRYYDKSFVVLEDPNNGEIFSMAGKKVIKNNGKYQTIDYTSGILTNPMTVGSVVKGASILVGYQEKAIKIGDYFYDSCVKIKSTPKKCSWKNLGMINDIQALALSSNVYQFKTAMKVAGYNYSYNMGLKVSKDVFNKYRNMYHSFGLGVKTGIDLPIESLGYSGIDNSSGLLLDFVMGQYETYTPIQLSQYISTLANKGTRYKPRLLREIRDSKTNEVIYTSKSEALNKVNVDSKYIDRVHKGFYAVMNASYGIGHNYISKKYTPAGKTGTSQSFLDRDLDGIIDTETISTAFIGFAPFKKPNMTITVTSPDISYEKSSYAYTADTTKRIAKKVSDAYFNSK